MHFLCSFLMVSARNVSRSITRQDAINSVVDEVVCTAVIVVKSGEESRRCNTKQISFQAFHSGPQTATMCRGSSSSSGGGGRLAVSAPTYLLRTL